ncbi:MAG: hypothetical protein IJ157_05325 [Clostridia bacterium]|nr:hypothetical protein [Clostridia bacterium]
MQVKSRETPKKTSLQPVYPQNSQKRIPQNVEKIPLDMIGFFQTSNSLFTKLSTEETAGPARSRALRQGKNRVSINRHPAMGNGIGIPFPIDPSSGFSIVGIENKRYPRAAMGNPSKLPGVRKRKKRSEGKLAFL